MWKIIVGLISTMLANIFLGASIAEFQKKFNKEALINGFFKAFCLLVSCLLIYAGAVLNPDIFVASINGTEMNLIEGMKTIFVAGIIYYGGKDLIKLANLLKIKTNIKEKDDVNEK